MSVGILGRKIGMTQVYGEDGVIVPVTVIEAGPCVVLQVKTADVDGYHAVQLGFDDKLSRKDAERDASQRNRRRASRAERGHVASISSKRQASRTAAGVKTRQRAECEPKRFIREFRTDDKHGLSVGQQLTVAAIAEFKAVDVIGLNKGRGTSGVMKRHNFSGQRATHGVKRVHRRPGSIGNRTDPGRVFPGMRMAGVWGNERVTVRNLKVVKVDEASNMLMVRGAIPGANGGYVIVRKTNKCG